MSFSRYRSLFHDKILNFDSYYMYLQTVLLQLFKKKRGGGSINGTIRHARLHITLTQTRKLQCEL